MHRFHHISQIALVLALIPLTVFNGRAMAGCVCSDGHFELLCRGQGCCSHAASAQHTKCCCRSKAGAPKSCCNSKEWPNGSPQYSSTEKSESCCHPLNLLPMVADGEGTPQLDVELLALAPTVALNPLPVLVERPACVYAVDSGPPRDLLQLLQRLLI